MTESYFHNGCAVIILPLCLDNEMLSAVAIKEHASVLYEHQSFIGGSRCVAMQLHYYIWMCDSHLHKMASGNTLLLGKNSYCVLVYIAVLRGMRAEKVDYYCSNCGIGKISFSSSSFFLTHTVPFLMAPAPGVLGVKGEFVKVEPQLVLLSELTMKLIFRGLISSGIWLVQKCIFHCFPPPTPVTTSVLYSQICKLFTGITFPQLNPV